MNKKYSGIIFVALLFSLSQSSMAATITSSFDVDLDGWTGTLVEISHVGTGGNPGGFLLANDLPFGSDLHAPDKFLGDLSAFDGGTLSFDIKVFSSDLAPGGRGGDVTLHSGSVTARQNVIDVPSLPVPSAWTNGSVAFTAIAWGVDQLTWEALISNITAIDVRVDPSQGANNLDLSGFDNFTIQAVPVPATVWLFCSGLLSLFVTARRKKNKK